MIKHRPHALGEVLIVDATGEASEVIATVLQRRGFLTWEASANEEGLDLLADRRPTVAVVELKDDGQAREWSTRFREASRRQGTGLVLVGETSLNGEASDSVRSIDKPYRFDSLIRTIEELSARAKTDEDRSQGGSIP